MNAKLIEKGLSYGSATIAGADSINGAKQEIDKDQKAEMI